MNSLNPFVITMGCPAGVGPEIIIKALASKPDWLNPAKIVVIGDLAVMERAQKICSSSLEINKWKPGQPLKSGALNLLETTQLDLTQIPFGKPSKETGLASYKYIVKAIEFCKKGLFSAIVTAPISKIGLKLANINYPGHTEILAEKSNAKEYGMMMAGPRLKVVLTTIHCPLSEVAGLISKENIVKKLVLMNHSLHHDFGIKRPKIGVAGLNPHAGEQGTIGKEEQEIIYPAIQEAQAKGINCIGPYPPDTIFFHGSQGEYDAILCMYHDQGLIPFKLLHFWDGVNVTIGLPIIRTSVDHGTAYDIAGTGKANPASLIEAVNVASHMAKCRLGHQS